jgi:glycerol-3-phosphate acyltransferase PlsY
MTPAAAIFGVLVVLFAVCALLPVTASAFFGYRAGKRLATGIGAIAGLVLLMSCTLLAYLPHISQQLSEEDRHLALFVVFFAAVPALCIFLGTLAGYIAMGFLGLAHEQD